MVSDLDLYVQNICHCIQDKTQKVLPHIHRYGEWWLLLVDTIMPWGLEPDEVNQAKTRITNIGCFHKVIVIDSSGNSSLLEIGGGLAPNNETTTLA
jgi:hypothetical protein